MARILLIDDEKNILKVISALLKGEGYEVVAFERAEDGLRFLEDNPVDVVITDKMMPGMDGIEFLRAAKSRAAGTAFMIITAYGSIEDAVNAVKAGADHYLTKPIDDKELIEKIDYLLKKKRSQQDERTTTFSGMVGQSSAMREVFKTITLIAKSKANVLITGESGTGKELIAGSIHSLSDRKDNPFVAINCSAIPENLFENEIFGHEKGSFTGAYQRETGRIEQGGCGTVFLDEIGDISIPHQAKLLRVLQEREFLRIGGGEPVRANCRFIFATNRNLEDMVRARRFREDLFYRINVIPIDVPPLRERLEDIPLLARHFLEKYSSENEKEIVDIDAGALEVLQRYLWPGNIRELENIIERAVVLCHGMKLTRDNLPKRMLLHQIELPARHAGTGIISEFEKRAVLEALEQNKWNQTRAAEYLGISRKQLRTKMKNYNLGV